MADGHQDWAAFEISPTLGERIQNWLAKKGIGQPVESRDLANPKPPAGLWSAINNVIAAAFVSAFLALLWFAIFDAIPEIVAVSGSIGAKQSDVRAFPYRAY